MKFNNCNTSNKKLDSSQEDNFILNTTIDKFPILNQKNLPNYYQNLLDLNELFKHINKNLNELSFLYKAIIKFTKVLNFIISSALIIFVYYCYIYMNLLPLLESTSNGVDFRFWLSSNNSSEIYWKSMVRFFIFHVLFFLFIWCFGKTVLTNPGNIEKEYYDIYSLPAFIRNVFEYLLTEKSNEQPMINRDHTLTGTLSNLQWILNHQEEMTRLSNDYTNAVNEGNFNDPLIIKIDNFEEYFEKNILTTPKHVDYYTIEIKDVNYEVSRFCCFCLQKKPDRVHHCRRCRQCVNKWDHHCYFLAACIGEFNYKSFLLCLIYLVLILWYVLFTSFSMLSFYLHEHLVSSFTLYIIYYLILAILTPLLTWFLFGHLIYLLYNTTTIEFKEKTKEEFDNIFDLDLKDNFISVFGTNPLLWLFPITYTTKNQGYEYPVNRNYDMYKKNKYNQWKRKLAKMNMERNTKQNFKLPPKPQLAEILCNCQY